MRIFSILTINAILSLAFAGCTSYGTSPKGLEAPIENAAIQYAADVKEGGYKIVDTETLKKWLDQGKMVAIISTLQVNTDKTFGTLPSSVNAAMPLTEKEVSQAGKDNLLKVAGSDKKKTIVLYCGFVACRRSHVGAKILVDSGFENVYRYPGGIAAWQEMGYPITK